MCRSKLRMLKGKLSTRCNPKELVHRDCFWRTSWVDHHVTLLVLLFYLIAVIASIVLPHKFGTSYELRWFANIETNTIGTIWQVQTMFLSFGYAALAIAIQVFSYGSVSIGVSRKQLLKTIKADRFAISGLVANGVLAIKTTLKTVPIDSLICLAWLLLTISFLVNSTWKLLKLYSTPAAVDFLARETLKRTIVTRGNKQFERLKKPIHKLRKLNVHTEVTYVWEHRQNSILVPPSLPGRVIDSYQYSAIAELRSDLDDLNERDPKDELEEKHQRNPIVIVHALPGMRTHLNRPLITIKIDYETSDEEQVSIIKDWQRTVSYAPPEVVTVDEEIELEAANLYDAISIGLRSGAFSKAQQAIKILWAIAFDISNTYSSTDTEKQPEQDYLLKRIFRLIAHAEQNCILSPQAANFFIEHTVSNLSLSRTLKQRNYAEACIHSIIRIWSDITAQPNSKDFETSLHYALTSLRSLTFSRKGDDKELSLRTIWALAEMVKRSLDAKDAQAAIISATALDNFFSERTSNEEILDNVTAAKLVLSSWNKYLALKEESCHIENSAFTNAIQPSRSLDRLLRAMMLLEGGETALTTWRFWELKPQNSNVAQPLVFTRYIDETLLECVLKSYGRFLNIENNRIANLYSRMRVLLDSDPFNVHTNSDTRRQHLDERLKEWSIRETKRLAATNLSNERIEKLREELASTLLEEQRISDILPRSSKTPPFDNGNPVIIGTDLLLPRQDLVDGVFNGHSSSISGFGSELAASFCEKENINIITELRSLEGTHHDYSVGSISFQIEELGDEAQYYVLLTSHHLWQFEMPGNQKKLKDISHFQLPSMEEDVILFDSRNTLSLYRAPEKKDGLTPIGTSDIALGVFEDVPSDSEPRIRIEAGEYFVLEAGNDPSIHFFDIVPDEQ